MNTSRFDCEEIELLLDAYFDGELSENSYLSVEDHLNRCVECKSKLQQIRQTVSILQELPQLSLKRDLINDLDELLNRDKKVRLQRRLFIGGAFGVAAAIVFLIITSFNPRFTRIAQVSKDKEVMTYLSRQKSIEIEVANAFGNDQNCISETLGCNTDEDGLYAFKM